MEKNVIPAPVEKITASLMEGRPFQITRLFGGGNNQAYRIDSDQGPRFLKVYYQDAEDTRKRGETEFKWLMALCQSGIREIPEPLGFEVTPELSAGLYGFLHGRTLNTGEITRARVIQAADFICKINSVRQSEAATALAPASEACFSMKEHFSTVHKRVGRLFEISESEGPLFKDAKELVSRKINPVWEKIASAAAPYSDETLKQESRILSPSDFGFHNALVSDQGEMRFIDFEYAGWDDPAKLVCDFFCQVSLPVSGEHLGAFLEKISSLVPDREHLHSRVSALLPVYRIKWVCILLNHFLPSGARRKKFALKNSDEWETLLKNQLAKASEQLQLVGKPWHI